MNEKINSLNDLCWRNDLHKTLKPLIRMTCVGDRLVKCEQDSISEENEIIK